jgi:hypothetical protein
MEQARLTAFNIINNRNLTDNECDLIRFFHEELTAEEVKLRAGNGIATTFFCDGLFTVEEGKKQFVFRRGIYQDRWPKGAEVNNFNANLEFFKLMSNIVTHNTQCEFPHVKFCSAHFHLEVNDGDVAGCYPWNIAPSMPIYIKARGFDHGWSHTSFIRFSK